MTIPATGEMNDICFENVQRWIFVSFSTHILASCQVQWHSQIKLFFLSLFFQVKTYKHKQSIGHPPNTPTIHFSHGGYQTQGSITNIMESGSWLAFISTTKVKNGRQII